MAKKILKASDIEGRKLIATSDFEIPLLGIKLEAGSEFVPPAGWVQDKHQEEFLNASKIKRGKSVGVVFTYPGEIINPGEKNPSLRERRQHTAVLPIELR